MREANGTISIVFRENQEHVHLHDHVLSHALANGLSCSIIDGLSFSEKLEICSHHRIVCGIAPYGSSMMFPIYVLNCILGIIGAEVFSNNLDSWRWHITRFCHEKRVFKETYVSSTFRGGNGYIVSTESIEAYLNMAMSAINTSDRENLL